MKYHLDVKNHKVLFGLLSLLFVTSIVQTSAILKSETPDDTQVAQVTSSGSCVTIDHNYNQLFSNPFLMADATGTPRPDDYTYTLNVNITNGCPRPINIIDPDSLNTHVGGKGGVSVSDFSYFGADLLIGGIVPVSPLSGNFYGITPIYELGTCTNCGQGSFQYQFSPLGTHTHQNQPALRVYTVPVGQTRNFDLSVAVGVPHSTENAGWLRARLLRLKWFYTSAYADNLVNANEIKTLSLSSSQQEEFATDWAIVTQDGNGPAMCPVGQAPVFNDMYEPVCQ